VVKDVEAFDRLLDETALHLHRVEAELPDEQRGRLERLHKPEASLAGKKVLIVDDDIRNIFALTSLLERPQDGGGLRRERPRRHRVPRRSPTTSTSS
jgi:hypothetical protein